MISSTDAKKIIRQEIAWCKKNRGMCHAEFERGFIKGLRQAIFLIRSAEKPVHGR